MNDEWRLRLFCSYSPFRKVFLEWRLGIEENLRIHLVKSIQSFSSFILHLMHCVQMIISWKFCHYSFLMDTKDSPPTLEKEPLLPLFKCERWLRPICRSSGKLSYQYMYMKDWRLFVENILCRLILFCCFTFPIVFTMPPFGAATTSQWKN